MRTDVWYNRIEQLMGTGIWRSLDKYIIDLDMESKVAIKCKLHPNFDILYVSLAENIPSPLICAECVIQKRTIILAHALEHLHDFLAARNLDPEKQLQNDEVLERFVRKSENTCLLYTSPSPRDQA
eukprot:TRINITY_DN3220_c0_g1_i7.p1 TRINITY_DN3220_c0_g1~~TRINITY_DN3220_c0_g1_i7.p1  ORF type:complete len:126 (-),score=8.25 TRINITY_DN3220_c0_g1_i7:108-485(-)